MMLETGSRMKDVRSVQVIVKELGKRPKVCVPQSQDIRMPRMTVKLTDMHIHMVLLLCRHIAFSMHHNSFWLLHNADLDAVLLTILNAAFK
eukprot:scaffold212830_cov18-Tisochrysis_lutea.AAC.1